MNTGIHIGHETATIVETRSTILAIINAPTGDNVKTAALEALTKMLAIEGLTIRDCHIQGDTKNEHHHHPLPEAGDDSDWEGDLGDEA
jgi:hypothetical protein